VGIIAAAILDPEIPKKAWVPHRELSRRYWGG
jgi:hypothetical protein